MNEAKGRNEDERERILKNEKIRDGREKVKKKKKAKERREEEEIKGKEWKDKRNNVGGEQKRR